MVLQLGCILSFISFPSFLHMIRFCFPYQTNPSSLPYVPFHHTEAIVLSSETIFSRRKIKLKITEK